MVKKISIVLLAIIMMMSMVSCTSHSDEEIIEAAKTLIEKSYEVNEIYFGKGLPSTGEISLGLVSEYELVDPECGYSTVDQLKALAAEVYCEDYCEHLYTIAFKGISNNEDEESVSFARYIEDYAGKLTVSLDAKENGLILNRTYDLSTITVEKCVRNTATVKVQSLVDGQLDEILTISLVFENDHWRLNTPTY